MSIKKTSETGDKIVLELDNGHLEALKKITKDYNIIDLEKALGFALTVVSKNNGNPIKVGEDNLVPSKAIKNNPPEPSKPVEEKPAEDPK